MTTRADTSVGLALAAALLACGGSAERFRHTALVPAATLPAWDGAAVGEGKARLEGSGSVTSLERAGVPAETDSAVWVPSLTLEGAALLGVGAHTEFGLRGSYGAYAWAKPSAEGTDPLPEPLSTWSVGPELRVVLAPTGRFRLGFLVGLERVSIPTALWQDTCVGAVCSGDRVFLGRKTETELGYAFSLHGAVDLADDGASGSALLALGAGSAFQNDAASLGDTDAIESALSVVVGAGYGVRFDAVSLALLGLLPVETGEVGHGPGAALSVAVTPEVWAATP